MYCYISYVLINDELLIIKLYIFVIKWYIIIVKLRRFDTKCIIGGRNMIKKLSLKNYKSFKDIDIDFADSKKQAVIWIWFMGKTARGNLI